METVLIVIHLMLVLALVGTVLLQRSEGGALGIGGGGGGGFMSGRGAGSALTRATAILAAGFFVTSISLTLIHRDGGPSSILQGIDSQSGQPAGDQPLLQRESDGNQPAQPQAPAPGADQESGTPQVPRSE